MQIKVDFFTKKCRITCDLIDKKDSRGHPRALDKGGRRENYGRDFSQRIASDSRVQDARGEEGV